MICGARSARNYVAQPAPEWWPRRSTGHAAKRALCPARLWPGSDLPVRAQPAPRQRSQRSLPPVTKAHPAPKFQRRHLAMPGPQQHPQKHPRQSRRPRLSASGSQGLASPSKAPERAPSQDTCHQTGGGLATAGGQRTSARRLFALSLGHRKLCIRPLADLPSATLLQPLCPWPGPADAGRPCGRWGGAAPLRGAAPLLSCHMVTSHASHHMISGSGSGSVQAWRCPVGGPGQRPVRSDRNQIHPDQCLALIA